MHKMRPQTQHINVHFCNKVANRHMTVKQADLRTAATGGHAHKAMQSGDFSLSLINGPSWVGDYSLMGWGSVVIMWMLVYSWLLSDMSSDGFCQPADSQTIRFPSGPPPTKWTYTHQFVCRDLPQYMGEEEWLVHSRNSLRALPSRFVHQQSRTGRVPKRKE